MLFTARRGHSSTLSEDGITIMTARWLVLSCIVGGAWAQPNQVQVSPAVLSFNDANLGFSQSITVIANNPGILIEVAIDSGTPNSPAPSWLTVTPRLINAPARVTVAASRPGVGSFFARVAFRQRSGATTTELNAVLVRVETQRATDPFSVSPSYLSFYNQAGNPVDPQSIYLTGANCQQVRVETSETWIQVTPDSESANCGRLNVAIRSIGFPPGGQTGSIRILLGEVTQTVRVALFLAGRGPALAINPEGLQFEARSGNGNAAARNLLVLNPGDNVLAWTARVVDPRDGAPWLTLGAQSGTATQAAEGRIPVTVNPSSLPAGQYSALIEVSAPGARNSPQLCPVVFGVQAEDSPAVATPSPSGMLFTVVEGTGRSNPQALTVFTSNRQAIPYQTSVHTYDNSGWLNADVTVNTASTASAGRVNVTVNPGSLAAGIYRGEVNVFIASRASVELRSVNVTMIVTPAPPPPPPPQRPPTNTGGLTSGPFALENCSRNALIATHTGLVNNFQTRIGWPTPLILRVVDNCGEAITTAQVLLEFSNADPPLAMTNLNNGSYIATWAPRTAVTTSMSVRAAVTTGQLATRVELLGRVLPATTPVIEPGGVLNRFDRRPGMQLPVGGLIELTGAGFSDITGTIQPENDKLPDTANGITIFMGSTKAPIAATSPRQLSAQLPWGFEPDQLLPMVVKAGSALSVPVRVGLARTQPGIASNADARVIAFDENVLEVNAANKAKRGGLIYLLTAGLGATSPVVPVGAVSPGDPFAVVDSPPTVTVGGKEAVVRIAGLSPGLVGIYQIEAFVPEDAESGDLPVVVRQGTAVSNTALIPVE
jgi:uncharacterized protein (TIGR03437 family)